jgi:phosphatidylglycerophosphate synthase
MATEAYHPTDRRPIASREGKLWQRIARFLANRHISPNFISIAGMVIGIAAGVILAATNFAQSSRLQHLLWLAAAAGIQIRLLANMLDGMVAVLGQKASRLGELYNELPDRVSDVAIIIGAGYAAGSLPTLGYVAACVAVLVAYIRAVGKAAGVANLFIGPMAKPHRMFVLTLVALWMAATPRSWQPVWGDQQAGLLAIGLAVIILGGLLTIFRRLRLIVRHLKSLDELSR